MVEILPRETPVDWAKIRAWVAFGANLPSDNGAPIETLKAAVEGLRAEGIRLCGLSRIYETPCFPAGAGPDYINCVMELSSSYAPEDLLRALHRVEQDLGRVRKRRWAGRTIDLDLLAMDQQVLPDAKSVKLWIDLPICEQSVRAPDQLILPHPRIQDRSFMLIPFADLAPDWRHPLLGKTVQEMLDARPESEKTEVKALEGVEIPLD
ncbi:2-amino-4-hydroxy-6-hydroxymethyldihydropteridine diphosphokinase [Celeribacter neptunius]|uniref:2-amino-4-hydroxy-6-hydroxymethyldihydropteridine pyrophosphokinase n=1 Tax=Celeribacter neptunius TaxID=588602 RepID=A0A1I3X2T4_9RHOB|nr:2-amino-4-hydroxy-6-hydroxymethyldihydropteridine diphosphokinase [Celeribacter neptunius]SFK13903.1 2-amino-4-hydroxy-6-hydroxymethyldihydropteridinediphosphokinase [Celeribacter neptunius]